MTGMIALGLWVVGASVTVYGAYRHQKNSELEDWVHAVVSSEDYEKGHVFDFRDLSSEAGCSQKALERTFRRLVAQRRLIVMRVNGTSSYFPAHKPLPSSYLSKIS